MTLCGVRPEGFGPSSSISSPLPTSCFTDTILLPLPIWLFLASLPALCAVHHLTRSSRLNPENQTISVPSRKNCVQRTLVGLYYAFIMVNILMETLEIVRLSMENYGIGLLPFIYVGLLGGAYLHFSNGVHGRIPSWVYSNCILLWIGGFVMNVVKVAGLVMDDDERKGTKYPLEDQITDVGVVAGVYVVILGLEIVLAVRRTASKKAVVRKGDGESLHSGEISKQETVER
ncbi:hypothetical protein BJ875DRAFT_444315 [Amylocarpus encephaloides]|uniref:Uncharacterized protein n=1 Tax=Amylocarpus encephaloides TaxID=45428 RepID=A0A9P7YC68_9HELO|nr:hypothetical protein BJ875DRAFT_444315 [Amylocarpus encephaloides]